MYFDFYDDRPDYEALSREYARLEDLLHLIIAVASLCSRGAAPMPP